MKVAGFVEGARTESGGVGLVGVPLIHRALARRGHQDLLAIGGLPMPTAVGMERESAASVLDADGASASAKTFGAVGRWCFSPRLVAEMDSIVLRADFVTLHSAYSFPVLAGYLLARRHHKPYGLWPHGVFAPVQREVAHLRKAVYGRLVLRRMLDNASVLFYSAAGEREEAEGLRLRAPSVVIPHGIDVASLAAPLPRGAFRRRFLGGYDGPMVLYLGRLNRKKGLDLLTEAVARVRAVTSDFRLVIAGGADPPDFDSSVRTWVRVAGIDDITVLTGRLDEAAKVQALADCDLFVLPSAAENFGFAMFEAMAAGRAVVCSDTLNYAGEVERCDAGVVVRRRPEDLAAAIASLLGDPDRRNQMGQNGRRLASQFSWERCGESVETAIRCVLDGTPFPSDLNPHSGHR